MTRRAPIADSRPLHARLLAQDLGELLESPRWHRKRQRISLVDVPTGRVIEIAPDSHAVSEYQTEIKPLSAALPWGTSGYLLVGSDGIWAWSPHGATTLWAEIPHELDIVSNDALLHDGAVWVGRMDVYERPGAGSLWRIGPGVAQIVAGGLTLPNGLVPTRGARGVLFAESAARSIYCLPADAQNLNPASLALHLAVPDWIPDGLARDHLGHLWVARWGEGAVTRIPTASLPQLDVHISTLQTTAAAFDPHGDMYITTARENFDARQRVADPFAGSVFAASIIDTRSARKR